MIRKAIVSFACTIFFFLVQSCAMTYLEIGHVSANLLIAWIAIILVSLGTSYAACVSLLCGILMECTMSSVQALYLLLYPIAALIACALFADYGERKMERKQLAREQLLSGTGTGRLIARRLKRLLHINYTRERPLQLPPWIRILLSAAFIEGVFQLILVLYGYLNGYGLDMGHLGRALLAVLYTTAAALVLMIPLRALIGMYQKYRSKDQQH